MNYNIIFLPYYYLFFYYLFFWLASPASITCIHTSMFNVQYGTVILSLYFPYPNNFPSLAFMKEHFYIFLVRITRFYTIYLSQRFSRGGTPVPIPLHIYNIKTIMSYACLCREGIAVVQKDHAPTKNKLVCTGK